MKIKSKNEDFIEIKIEYLNRKNEEFKKRIEYFWNQNEKNIQKLMNKNREKNNTIMIKKKFKSTKA